MKYYHNLSRKLYVFSIWHMHVFTQMFIVKNNDKCFLIVSYVGTRFNLFRMGLIFTMMIEYSSMVNYHLASYFKIIYVYHLLNYVLQVIIETQNSIET